MKKLIFAFVILFVLCGSASAEIFTLEVDKKWDAVSIAVDTNWFASNIKPSSSSQRINAHTVSRRGISSPVGNPVKHTFQFSCPTATVINLQIKFAGLTKTFTFNDGVAIGVNIGKNFSVVLHTGMSYNIQHKTDTQNCAVVITESFNVDL